jgi:hypothetical protein
MNAEFVPLRGENCPSRVRLEAHSVGEEPALESHVAQCPHCGPYVVSLREKTDAYVRGRPPELFLQQLDRRVEPPVERRWWPALLGAALSAALVTLLVWPEPVPDARLKGDSFRVFFKRGDAEPIPLRMDQPVRAADQLRFSFSAPAAGRLAIFELDGTEAVELLTSLEVKAETAVLPGAFALDAAPGPEWFVAVFSTKPLDLEAIAAQLKGQARQPRLTVECEPCTVDAFRVVKELP